MKIEPKYTVVIDSSRIKTSKIRLIKAISEVLEIGIASVIAQFKRGEPFFLGVYGDEVCHALVFSPSELNELLAVLEPHIKVRVVPAGPPFYCL